MKTWDEIPEDIRRAVIFTLECDAQDSADCTCNREDKRCKLMAEGYSAAVELLRSKES